MREKTIKSFSQVPMYHNKNCGWGSIYGTVLFKNAPNVCLSIVWGRNTYSNWLHYGIYETGRKTYEIAIIRDNSDGTRDYFPVENWVDPKKYKGDYSGDVSGWISANQITHIIKNISKEHGQAYCKLKR